MRTYPVYAPDREPKGYREWMLKQGFQRMIEPETLKTEAAWIEAGRRVFQGLDFPVTRTDDPRVFKFLSDAEAIKKGGDSITKDGIIPALRWSILKGIRVGTDPSLALKTRKGTGYYKVPSLKGLWYRGLIEHSGSIASLEEWFDPKRLRDDYVPGGWKAPGATTRAVKGHELGLDLAPEDTRSDRVLEDALSRRNGHPKNQLVRPSCKTPRSRGQESGKRFCESLRPPR